LEASSDQDFASAAQAAAFRLRSRHAPRLCLWLDRSQFCDGPRFNLDDSLRCQAHLFTDLDTGVGISISQTVSEPDNVALKSR
jgi:hypothetical protein